MGSIANSDTLGITTNEVYQAITQPSDNKASGSDQITAEHIKFANPKVAAFLAICISCIMTH